MGKGPARIMYGLVAIGMGLQGITPGSAADGPARPIRTGNGTRRIGTRIVTATTIRPRASGGTAAPGISRLCCLGSRRIPGFPVTDTPSRALNADWHDGMPDGPVDSGDSCALSRAFLAFRPRAKRFEVGLPPQEFTRPVGADQFRRDDPLPHGGRLRWHPARLEFTLSRAPNSCASPRRQIGCPQERCRRC